jgi:hypothetical protein
VPSNAAYLPILEDPLDTDVARSSHSDDDDVDDHKDNGHHHIDVDGLHNDDDDDDDDVDDIDEDDVGGVADGLDQSLLVGGDNSHHHHRRRHPLHRPRRRRRRDLLPSDLLADNAAAAKSHWRSRRFGELDIDALKSINGAGGGGGVGSSAVPGNAAGNSSGTNSLSSSGQRAIGNGAVTVAANDDDDASGMAAGLSASGTALWQHINDSALMTRDWNREFQEVQEKTEWFYGADLTNISLEFADTALTYGKIIISEASLPLHQKTLKPARLGGVAGGDKFVVHGILFKFASDSLVCTDPPIWLYGGSERDDEAAVKAASHELEARDRWFLRSIPERLLRFPLVCLVTYKGYRLVAMSLLPISRSTLVYGSADGGVSVLSSDGRVAGVVEAAAARINLAKHDVGRRRVPIAGPGDVEVHRGKDDRYYMLDFGRTMPPEAPPLRGELSGGAPHNARAIFHRLLRPALVERFPRALNSDAFSAFNEYDANKSQQNDDVREATAHLYNRVIPMFAADLERRYGSGPPMTDPEPFSSGEVGGLLNVPTTPTLSWIGSDAWLQTHTVGAQYVNASAGGAARHDRHGNDSVFARLRERLQSISAWRLHKAGINCRHLGRIRALLHSPPLRRVVLSVIAARCMKQELDRRMRAMMSAQSVRAVPSDEPFKRMACEFFNSCFESGCMDRCKAYWTSSLRQQIEARFPLALSDAERDPEFDLRESVSVSAVFVMAVELSAMKLAPDAEHHLLETASGRRETAFALRDIDILEIGSTVKMSQVVHHGRAVHMLLEGINCVDSAQARRVLGVAHTAAVVAWRHAVDGELQRTILSLIEIELACVDEDEAISRAMFASAMNVFWEISSTWQSPKLFDAWHISLDRVEVHCIAHPVLVVDPQIPLMLAHWRDVLMRCQASARFVAQRGPIDAYHLDVSESPAPADSAFSGIDRVLSAMRASVERRRAAITAGAAAQAVAGGAQSTATLL